MGQRLRGEIDEGLESKRREQESANKRLDFNLLYASCGREPGLQSDDFHVDTTCCFVLARASQRSLPLMAKARTIATLISDLLPAQ